MNELRFAVAPPASAPASCCDVVAEGVDELAGRRGTGLEWLVDERFEAGEWDSEARLRRDSELVVREWSRSQGCPLAERVCKTAVGREHQGHAALVCGGELACASLKALSAEALDVVEGSLLDLTDAIAEALVRPVEDCALGRARGKARRPSASSRRRRIRAISSFISRAMRQLLVYLSPRVIAGLGLDAKCFWGSELAENCLEGNVKGLPRTRAPVLPHGVMKSRCTKRASRRQGSWMLPLSMNIGARCAAPPDTPSVQHPGHSHKS